jgi:hypothetical protein
MLSISVWTQEPSTAENFCVSSVYQDRKSFRGGVGEWHKDNKLLGISIRMCNRIHTLICLV